MLERLSCWSASATLALSQHKVLTPELKLEYDQRVIDYLKKVGDFFDYKPGVASFLASEHKGP